MRLVRCGRLAVGAVSRRSLPVRQGLREDRAGALPGRVSRVVICNAPQWFQVVWKVVRPWVDPKTAAKVSIVRAGVETFECVARDLRRFPDPRVVRRFQQGPGTVRARA